MVTDCTPYIDCDLKGLGLEDLLRLLITVDANGCPALRINAGALSQAVADMFVMNETPTGVINGSNKVFTTANNFVTGKTAVYLSGVRQILGVDYTETASNIITFTIAPLVSDKISIDYLKS